MLDEDLTPYCKCMTVDKELACLVVTETEVFQFQLQLEFYQIKSNFAVQEVMVLSKLIVFQAHLKNCLVLNKTFKNITETETQS